ncbi:MAG: hypothetical protein KC800_00220 [Candidatus Eremiobacteraeota bacterium]|nr:hypothetical protein [Candidatus Eremiobacteraeota bacterium]
MVGRFGGTNEFEFWEQSRQRANHHLLIQGDREHSLSDMDQRFAIGGGKVIDSDHRSDRTPIREARAPAAPNPQINI